MSKTCSLLEKQGFCETAVTAIIITHFTFVKLLLILLFLSLSLSLSQIFLTTNPACTVSSAICSCTIGRSQCCGHITGTLYLIAHYKLSGVKSVPQDVVKTSLPQTWHIPRGDRIRGMEVQEVQVVGYGNRQSDRHQPIKSTLYNPIRTMFPESFDTFFEKLRVTNPSSTLLTTVPPTGTPFPEQVPTKFGPFPKGCAISYQQKLSPSYVLNIVDAQVFPDLPTSCDNVGDNRYSSALTEAQVSVLESLGVTQLEATEIEKTTRLQSNEPKWKKLRSHDRADVV